jgi:hypothetical protein
MDLVESVTRFEKFKLTPEYERQKYESKLISKWITSTPYNLQSDILSVYYKALAYSTSTSASNSISSCFFRYKISSISCIFNLGII